VTLTTEQTHIRETVLKGSNVPRVSNHPRSTWHGRRVASSSSQCQT
jgi:hypothetical protein